MKTIVKGKSFCFLLEGSTCRNESKGLMIFVFWKNNEYHW